MVNKDLIYISGLLIILYNIYLFKKKEEGDKYIKICILLLSFSVSHYNINLGLLLAITYILY